MSTADKPSDRVPVIVVGAGPAGLATSAELTRRGIGHEVLEGGSELGSSWANLYDSLRLHTGKHMSSLPGMRFPASTPMFPSRSDFLEYLQSYARKFRLPIRTGRAVTRAERLEGGSGWLVHTEGAAIRANALVFATGIVSNPRVPVIPGRERFSGRVMHSVEYRRPEGFSGRRVLVVGVGNSGAEIGSELARAGIQVTVAVRSGANVVPLQMLGIPIQYLSYLLRKLPRVAQERVVALMGRVTEARRGPPVLPRPAHSPLDAIPLIGFHLVDAIREGLIDVRGAIERFTERGVRFADGSEAEFDDVILATGFTAALGPLAGSVRVDQRGFARRIDRVTSADHPSLYFVGHNYDSTGGLFNINVDSRLVAARLAAERN